MRFRSLFFATILLLSACNGAVTATPTEPPPTATAPPPTETSPPPTATPVPVLPAPLLFLSDRSGSNQIWRLADDSVTLTQLTNEAAPVIDFDVSPVDGRLAYVSGNDLLIVNADGAERMVFVNGPDLPPAPDSSSQISSSIGQPHWSPDGTQIAFGLNGVNLLGLSGGTPTVLIASDSVPQPPDFEPQGARFYWPSQWSPDGSRLLVNFAYFPEGGGVGVINSSGGNLTDIVSPEGIVCCNESWSIDGTAIYYANDSVGLISAGLWRADATSGESVTLFEGVVDDVFTLVSHARQASDSRLYYFLTRTNGFPTGYASLTMYSAGVDGISNQIQLRGDAYAIGEALWAPDGRGAVIVDVTAGVNSAPISFAGPLLYLKSDGGLPIDLTDDGHNLHWGK